MLSTKKKDIRTIRRVTQVIEAPYFLHSQVYFYSDFRLSVEKSNPKYSQTVQRTNENSKQIHVAGAKRGKT